MNVQGTIRKEMYEALWHDIQYFENPTEGEPFLVFHPHKQHNPSVRYFVTIPDGGAPQNTAIRFSVLMENKTSTFMHAIATVYTNGFIFIHISGKEVYTRYNKMISNQLDREFSQKEEK